MYIHLMAALFCVNMTSWPPSGSMMSYQIDAMMRIYLPNFILIRFETMEFSAFL